MGTGGSALRTERRAGVAATGCFLLLRLLLSAKLLPRWCWCWLCSRLIVNQQAGWGRAMGEEMQGVEADTGWRKAIPEARDRLQAQVLVAMVGGWLLIESLSALWRMYETSRKDSDFARLNVEIVAASVVFALIVLGLRAATPAAAAFGGMISPDSSLGNCISALWSDAV